MTPLTRQAVATGDLTQKIIVPVEGQAMVELKDIINSMVDRLKTFAVEVERVSLEVGTQGCVEQSPVTLKLTTQ
jgi:osomolarity two-component system sensor histidine kinase NIK1